MLVKEDLVLVHKALSELTIKGSESYTIAALLDKVATMHSKSDVRIEKPQKKEK